MANWKRFRRTNGLERLLGEVKLRTRGIGAFPDRASALRLINAVALEFTGVWDDHRYLDMSLVKSIPDNFAVWISQEAFLPRISSEPTTQESGLERLDFCLRLDADCLGVWVQSRAMNVLAATHQLPPAAILPLLLGTFVLVSFIFAAVSGWRQLAQHYPAGGLCRAH